MSTSPETPADYGTDSIPSPGPAAEWAMILFSTVYPLLFGTTLELTRIIAVLGAGSSGSGGPVLFVIASVAMISGGHLWFQKILEGGNQPRPWRFPTILSTALVTTLAVEIARVQLNADSSLPLPLPLVCLGLALSGVGVFSLFQWRYRFMGALAAIIAVALVLVGVSWVFAEQERAEQREELVQDVSDFPHEIGVLDSPEWEPTEILITSQTVDIIYEPLDASPEAEGLSITLRTRTMEELEATGWTPLYALCESDGGDHECEEHEDGEIVVADRSNSIEARTEFTEGVAGYLISSTRKDSEDESEIEPPDIDMDELSELAGNIRPAEPGEAEEIAEDTS